MHTFQKVCALLGATILTATASNCAAAHAVPQPPDGRIYELVSPVDAGGADVVTFDRPDNFFGSEPPMIFTAENGDATLFRLTAVPPGTFDTLGKLDLFRADRTEQGWTTTYAGPPGSRFPTKQAQSLPLLATRDLSRLIFSAYGGNLDPDDGDPATQDFPDLLRRESDGQFIRVSKGDHQQPVPREAPFPQMGGISANGTHVVFITDRKILADDAVPGGQPLVYERVGGETRLVSIAETGEPIPGSFRAISDAGDVVVFGTGGNPSLDGPIYVRKDGATELVVGSGRYEGMSADGTHVIITSRDALSADDADTSRDVYRYDVGSGGLTRISSGLGAAGAGNSDACGASYGFAASQCDVAVVAVSEDGSAVYFVSPEATATDGIPDLPNLYLRRSDGTTFIATLDPQDVRTSNDGGLLTGSEYGRAVRLTPDGATLVLESVAPLAAADTDGLRDVYVYANDSGLQCASCSVEARPPFAEVRLQSTVDPNSPFTERQASGLNVTDDGSLVFFETAEALVPRDINGNVDVYQFKTQTGEVALISTGLAPEDSHYHGNSADGRDVFFLTPEALVPYDRNGTAMRLYDARIGGGFPRDPLPAPCTGSACRGAPASPPAAPHPGSAGYVGDTIRGCDRLERQAAQANKRASKLRQRAKALTRKAKKLQRQATRATGRRAVRMRQEAKRKRATARNKYKRSRKRREAAARLNRQVSTCHRRHG